MKAITQSKLRDALGLEDDMLPIWVYRMRILGYPPDWMKRAQLTSLDVAGQFDQSISKLKNLEEGEVQNELKYNKDSLIQFPGFNCPNPEGVKDDWIILGMPPYQESQELKAAIKKMDFFEPIPYKRTKFDTSKNETTNESNDKLSNQKSAIGETVSSPDQTNDCDDEIEILENHNEDCKKSNNEAANQDSFDEKVEKSISSIDLQISSASISYGTPVPKTLKPKLPSLEKWAVGMNELLHFENLQTSTGAYNAKIKSVLDKIRSRFNK
ncbi:PSP domain containing protein [Sarcoptes scabiei]|uniref:PSP domain containing protein n=1 Tax=Sarcoptes scabiei TaxID=52283 RepID=A0A132A981_SARSC|nr:PSP domain containing protein [Sarcoptes scabiei]